MSEIKFNSDFGSIYWLFAVVWGFMKWGFWWGIFSIFIPILPMIDLCQWIILKYFS